MSSSPLLGTFCGVDLPPRLQSTQRSLYVRFSTDSSVSNYGFQAAFGSALEGEKTSLSVAACGWFDHLWYKHPTADSRKDPPPFSSSGKYAVCVDGDGVSLPH